MVRATNSAPMYDLLSPYNLGLLSIDHLPKNIWKIMAKKKRERERD